MRSHLHQESYARSRHEIEELKRRCYQEENSAKQQKSEKFNAQQNQDSLRDQVRKLQERLEFIEDSRIFEDPDSPSSYGSTHISHQAHITSSSGKPSREPRTPRITRDDMSISGDVSDCQLDRCDPDELHNNSENLATSSGHLRREGSEKRGNEEPLQSIPLPCFQEKARTYALDDRNCLMSMTNHAAGIWTCTQRGMTIPSFPSSEMHLGKFPGHTEFQSWIVNFRTEVCTKAKNPMLALQWIREIEVAKSLDDLITPKSITGKKNPRLWRNGFDDGGSIEEVLR